jgi:fructosamine-3-kinase
MESKSKVTLSNDVLQRLFERHGIFGVTDFQPLGDGEYNSLYCAKNQENEYVIKIAPTNDAHSLTYERDMMAQEVATYQWMRAKTAIRVPIVYAFDESKTLIPSTYFIMEKLPGKPLHHNDWTLGEKKQAFAKTIENVAALHRVLGEGFGYPQNGLHSNWYLAIQAMVANLVGDAKRLGHPCPNGRKLLEYIDRFQTILQSVEARLVNFDVWDPNQIGSIIDGRVAVAWIDPERSFFGDPIADFVCLDFLHMELTQKQAVIDQYNRYTDSPFVITDSLQVRFAIMLGYLGIIMEVEKYARYSKKHYGWWRNVAVCKLLFHHSFQTLHRISKREKSLK